MLADAGWYRERNGSWLRLEIMRTYQVTVVNEHFSSSNEHQCRDMAEAWKHAIRGALAIASEQVSHGNPFFAAEVMLDEDKKRVGRYVVSVGASPLKD